MPPEARRLPEQSRRRVRCGGERGRGRRHGVVVDFSAQGSRSQLSCRAQPVLSLPQTRCDSMARAMQVIGFAAVASADMGPSARRLRGYAVNSTSLASSSNLCSSFCCWSGGCSGCGTDWNSRMYAPGCQVECSGPNCGPGKAHQYYNTQADWKTSCSTPVCGQDEEEASLLQHAPAGCEGLSRTVPSQCPAGVKGTSTGVEINTQKKCVYDPQCAEPGADPAAKCYEHTNCAYKS